MQISISETVQLEADFRTALENQELVLYYQPLFNLTTQEIQGFEALLRWQHPTRGLLLPQQFIPIVEQAQLNSELERWTLQGACLQLKQWQSEFPFLAKATIHVNLSEQQIQAENFVSFVKEQLATFNLDQAHLTLEVTEKKLIESQNLARKVLQDLEALGVNICLDDFGGVYSSLRYLSYFPIHEIKLDPSLIQDLKPGKTGQRNRQIIKAISSLCQNLEIKAIAEGVETAEQTMILRMCGYHFAQGFYFSHPLPASEIPALLTQ
jgi:EAL domain-containing protein (putative c-di-GMP-specific phosphodiesterase class I)